jgi:hypothetical protein
MRHHSVVTRWDAILLITLTSGVFSPLFGSIQLLLSVYFTFFGSVWIETYSSLLELVSIGTAGVIFHLIMFQCVLFIVGVAIVTFNPRLKRGILGRHSFEIRETGLFESTAFNETLHKWPAVDRVLQFMGRTFVRIAGSNWFVIPDRDFSSAADADLFRRELRRWADA